MPELIWKRYIDLNVTNGDIPAARSIYEKLIAKSHHIRIYKTFAEFEVEEVGNPENARAIFERGLSRLKEMKRSEDRANLLETWIQMEKSQGNIEGLEALVKRKPKKVRRKHVEKIGDEDGEEVEHEYIDYIFPDDSNVDNNSKILQMAYAWKKKKAEMDAKKARQDKALMAD